MTDASNPIEAVRARLDGGRKWLRGNREDRHGNVCAVGAVMAVEDNWQRRIDEIYPVIESAIVEQFPDRLRSSFAGVIPDFNDHPDTTWADVDLVLDKAARRWDEAVR